MKYNIKNEMIHKELRKFGVLVRTMSPYIKESTLHKCNWYFNKFMKGKWKSDKTDCINKEIVRVDGSKIRILVITPK